MKILLIGGTGILSTDTCKKAIENNMEVYCLNRGKHNYYLPAEARPIIADIRNPQELTEKTSGLSFDVVVDFLSYSPLQLKQSLSIFSRKCTHYIFISSSAAYIKNSEEDIITEDFPIGNPQWSYGSNKAACERLLIDECTKSGLNYTIVRPYVTYGNTRIPFGVISNGHYWSLANRILTDKPIVLWDGGKAICTLTHTKDFAIALVGLFQNAKAYGEAFHITSDERLSWKEVLCTLEDALSHRAQVIDMPSSEIGRLMPEIKDSLLGDKATNMRFDNSKIKSIVPQFENFIPFRDGIKQTVEFFHDNRFARSVDYLWDGRMDRMLKTYARQTPIDLKVSSLKLQGFDPDSLTLKNRLKYLVGRSNFLSNLFGK